MRILHTMLRVTDLQKSIDFYTQILEMKLLRQSENEEYKYTLAFIGYGDETDTTVLELTYNWGTTCEKIKKMGGVITREAGPVKGGTTVIAFVKDPDGYMIELINKKDAGKGLGETV